MWLGYGTFVGYFVACVILTGTISGLTPSERNSLNRGRHDFLRERDSISQRGIDPV